MEHGAPIEHAPHTDAVEPSYKLILLPGLDAMGVPQPMELRKDLDDLLTHPGILPGDPTQPDDILEVTISRHSKTLLPEGFSQTTTDVEIGEKENGTRLGRPP